ncbi:hypothetical protein ACWGJP_11995 [Microbacterium sp. NPDC055903]
MAVPQDAPPPLRRGERVATGFGVTSIALAAPWVIFDVATAFIALLPIEDQSIGYALFPLYLISIPLAALGVVFGAVGLLLGFRRRSSAILCGIGLVLSVASVLRIIGFLS